MIEETEENLEEDLEENLEEDLEEGEEDLEAEEPQLRQPIKLVDLNKTARKIRQGIMKDKLAKSDSE